MDFQQFLKWCEDTSLNTNIAVAEQLLVSPQTIRNWKRNQHVPHWVGYATLCIQHDVTPMPLTVSAIKSWQSDNGFKTYRDTAEAFNLKRQSIHQWFRRGSFPKWLSIAAPGYSVKHRLTGADKLIREQTFGDNR